MLIAENYKLIGPRIPAVRAATLGIPIVGTIFVNVASRLLPLMIGVGAAYYFTAKVAAPSLGMDTSKIPGAVLLGGASAGLLKLSSFEGLSPTVKIIMGLGGIGAATWSILWLFPGAPAPSQPREVLTPVLDKSEDLNSITGDFVSPAGQEKLNVSRTIKVQNEDIPAYEIRIRLTNHGKKVLHNVTFRTQEQVLFGLEKCEQALVMVPLDIAGVHTPLKAGETRLYSYLMPGCGRKAFGFVDKEWDALISLEVNSMDGASKVLSRVGFVLKY